MMTSSLTPVNNANQSYVALLNLQTGKIISYLRNNYFRLYEIIFRFYEILFRFYEKIFPLKRNIISCLRNSIS